MKLTQLNMVSWIFYVQLFASCFIASILVVNGWEGNHIVSVVSDNSRFYGWLAIQYTMIAMPLGMLFINYLYGYESNRKLFLSYINSPTIPSLSQKDSFVKYPLYALSLISVFAVIYTYMKLNTNPFYAIYEGMDAFALAGLRQEIGGEFKGSFTVRNLFGMTLTPILSYIAYAYWCMTKKRQYFIWFLVMFVFTFFILTHDLSKSPFAFFIFGFLLINVLINGGIQKKTFFFFGVAGLILIVTAIVFITRTTDFAKIAEGLVKRIILSQAIGTFLSFEYFTESHDFIGFASFLPAIRTALGMDVSESAYRILAIYFDPEGYRAGVVGVANSLFIQEAWANFELFGVIIAPFYVGMFIQLIYMYFLKSKKTPIMLGILAYMSSKMPITGGFNYFIFPDALLRIFFIFVSVYVAALFIKNFQRPHKNEISLFKNDS